MPSIARRTHGVVEDSIAVRVVIALMVEVAIVGVVAQGAVDALTGTAAIALAPVGYAFSYRRRRAPSFQVKVALAVGLVAALAAFVRGVEGARSFDDARVPLASLFLWVQVLHSFDVPRRRDLGFSAVSSLILVAEAGALSLGTGFLLFLIPWLALSAAYLFLTLRPASEEDAALVVVRRSTTGAAWPGRWATVRTIAAWTAAAAVAAGSVFLALPRLPGSYVQLPPFSVQDEVAVEDFSGQVANPALDVGPDGVARFSDLAYPGFGSSVDLRSRGRLSDELVLRVRSPQAALWRGQAYDTFDGVRWTASDEITTPLTRGFGDSFEVPPPIEGRSPDGRRVVTTFYVEQPLPNVVFAASVPDDLYFPAGSVSVDRYGSMRSPILLEPGLVYSVLSELPVRPPAHVPFDRTAWPPEVLERYTQLPPSLPGRVPTLAQRITGGQTTTVGRVRAVESWLRTNTRYRLDVAADPAGVDAVDHFLFERREGFCEHIASAMVVLLRSIGVPSRLVTGFGPGGRNAFTGYWEVAASDAHAWVEVLYPDVGWIAYDPTFGVPPADPGIGGRFIAPQVLRSIGTFLGGVVPEPVRRAMKAFGRALASSAGTLAAAWPLLLGSSAAAVPVLWWIGRRHRRRRRVPAPSASARAFAELETAMAARGHPRLEHQTPQEFLRSSREALSADERRDADLVVRLFELDRFSGEGVDPAEAENTIAAAARVARPPARASRR
jgi:transglutaminase-like putative cysteine protease